MRTGLPPEHVLPTPLRLSVIGDQLALSCGNSALSLNSLMKVDDERPGSVAVRASTFRQLIIQLSGHSLTLELGAGRLSINWADGHASLPEQMLPVFNSDLGGSDVSMFTLPAKALGDLLTQTKPSWADRDIRVPGVLLELGAGRLRLVALDGPSMAIVDSQVTSADVCSVLLPHDGLQSMVHMLSDAKSTDLATLTIGDKCVRLATGTRSAMVRVAAGKFPNYQRIVPPTHATPVVFHRRDLADAVRRVALTGEDIFSQVSFICRRDLVTLESESSREEFSVEYAGEDTEIRFDSKRLGKILGAIASDRVDLYIGNSLATPTQQLPAMFKSHGDDSVTFILVPIRK